MEAIESPENFTAFMFELGWDMRQPPQPLQDLTTHLQAMSEIVEAGEINASQLPGLLSSIKALIDSINQISNAPDGLFPASVNPTEFKNEFPGQLVQFLIIEHLLDSLPTVGTVLKALGVIRIDNVDETPTRPAYIRTEFAWQDLAGVLSDPFAILRNAYQWDTPGFKAEDVVENIWDLGEALRIDMRFERLDGVLEGFLTNGAIALEDVHNSSLRFSILEDTTTAVGLSLGVGLFMLPETSAEGAGFSILPYGKGEFDEEMELGENLTLQVKAAINLSGGVAILVGERLAGLEGPSSLGLESVEVKIC